MNVNVELQDPRRSSYTRITPGGPNGTVALRISECLCASGEALRLAIQYPIFNHRYNRAQGAAHGRLGNGPGLWRVLSSLIVNYLLTGTIIVSCCNAAG